MARDYTAANSDITNWGTLGGLDMSGRDYSVSLWIYPPDDANSGYWFAKWSAGQGLILRRTGSQSYQFLHNNTVYLSAAEGFLDAWSNAIVTFDTSEGDSWLYERGVQVDTEPATAAMNDNSADPLTAGNRTALDRDLEGGVCELAIWMDHILTASQRAMLADGFSPLFIRPLPDFYAPMIRETNDIVGGVIPGTDTSDPMAQPRIIYPTKPIVGLGTAAAPPSGRIMSSLVAHGGLAGQGGIAGKGGGLAA